MKAKVVLAALTALVALPALATPASARPADPAPGGPQRPHEADVEGTRNLDSLAVTATAGPGRSVTLAWDRSSRAETGQVPAGARRFVFLFDRSVRFNPDAFPTCARALIEEKGAAACPDGSQVGSGLAEYATGEPREVLAFNSRIGGSPGVLVVLPSNGVVLEQTLEHVSHQYREHYRWALDEILPPNDTPPQERAGTTRFRLSFGATREHRGRTVGFVESTARPGAALRFGLWSEFVTGQVLVPVAKARLGR
ncbi:hypothetical protein E1295_18565 [Nonomuraea mesophila]|uniref:Uncharacterized protein n=2 Tax=Nonomuraea mesophila TaxID=2530382 RepID=A0A4R5FIN6_9ACTN|nr:hypothetical protein E1295_18565 [Nonomuraea mesophila]